MARSFNGSTDRIDYANIINPAGANFSFACWADLSVVDANQYFFTVHNSTNTGVALAGYTGNSPASSLSLLHLGTSNRQRSTTASAITTGKHHVCFTADSGTGFSGFNIYLDGSALSSWLVESNGSGLTGGTGSFSLGARIYDDARNMAAAIWDVGAWNAVLTAEQVALLAQGWPPHSVARNALIFSPELDESIYDPWSGQNGTADGTTRVDSLGPAIGITLPGWSPASAGGGGIDGSATITLGAAALSSSGAVAVQPPTLTTDSATATSSTTADFAGTLVDDGGDGLFSAGPGFVWGTSPNPTTANNALDGTGFPTFSASQSGIPAGTTIYIRAYAANSAGTEYGNELTLDMPAIVDGSATITLAAATLSSSGAVADGPQGSAAITLGDLTLDSLGGTPAAVGSAAITLHAATLTATGTLADGITGTAGINLDAVTLSGSGTVTDGIDGSATITLAAATLSASGTVQLSSIGEVALTLDAVTVTTAGTVETPESLPGMLKRGMTWLHSKRHSYFTTDVVYRRGDATESNIKGTIGETQAGQLFESELILSGTLRDFIFRTEDFVSGGTLNAPQIMDEIEERDGTIWEVVEIGGEPCWRYSDPHRTAIRVHVAKLNASKL